MAQIWLNGAVFDVVSQEGARPALESVSMALQELGVQQIKVRAASGAQGYLVINQYQTLFVADDPQMPAE